MMEGLRDETIGLDEIDQYATVAKIADMNEDEQMMRNVVRSGSMWT